jgi:DNA-binding transcriptional ArsR family regulator
MYCAQRVENVRCFQKRLGKRLKKSENLFLNRLIFWGEHPKGYGAFKEGRVWIYNTLEEWSEQLKISKSSVRRAVSSLRKQGLVDAEYLSANRRDRTLFYSINYGKFKQLFGEEKRNVRCVQKSDVYEHINEHMGEHMYLTVNSKQKVNKSYKSEKSKFFDEKKQNLQEFSADMNSPAATGVPKPMIVQDMSKIWREEFPSSEFRLTQMIARYLVKAFKSNFKSSLKEWRKYLKLIKTSDFIMSGKFKVTLPWALKFSIMDRLKAGELGVDENKIPVDEIALSKKATVEACEHIESLKETDRCKEIRRKILKYHSSAVYNSWFRKVLMTEEEGKVIISCPSSFARDRIQNHYLKGWEKDVSMKELTLEEQVRLNIELLEETDKCKEVRREILQKVGIKTYKTWLEGIGLAEANGKLRAKYPSTFLKDHIEANYGDILNAYGIAVETAGQIGPAEKIQRYTDQKEKPEYRVCSLELRKEESPLRSISETLGSLLNHCCGEMIQV